MSRWIFISEKALKRAGMDYWKDLDVTTYLDYEDFLEEILERRFIMRLRKHPQTYADVQYEDDCLSCLARRVLESRKKFSVTIRKLA